MRSWTTFKPKNSWDDLQNKPAIFTDNQISWNEIVSKPDLITFNNLTGVKCELLTGVTGPTAGSTASVNHGLAVENIIGGLVCVSYVDNNSMGFFLSNEYSFAPGYKYGWVIRTTTLEIKLHLTEGYNMVNKLFNALIFYT